MCVKVCLSYIRLTFIKFTFSMVISFFTVMDKTGKLSLNEIFNFLSQQ